MDNWQVKNKIELKKELAYLGILEKAREIYSELGVRGVVSYIRSSYRLLSKVYHPDLNPGNIEKAMRIQLSLNQVNRLIGEMEDGDIIEAIRKETKEETERKKKILVVEDEFGLQDTFRDILMLEGYDVRVAVDGNSGYALYFQFNPDLIFTDVVMPGMNGLELVARIREQDPRIKVVYMSGFFGIKRLEKQIKEELVRYGYPSLSKPFRVSKMLNLLHDYLNSSHPEPPSF